MTKIVSLDQIKTTLSSIDTTLLLKMIEDGFVAYSQNQAVVPPVGHLAFTHPPADVHIKYGYIKGDEYYVLKVASGFYDNPQNGLPSSNGVMLVFSQKTGELLSVLLDEGYLTDVRTAVAGAIAAKYLAPSHVKAIGIVGTGIQARLQLRYLQSVTDCKKAYVWGRSEKARADYTKEMRQDGFDIIPTDDIEELTMNSNLIVTTTPTTEPLIKSVHLMPGTHITAMGADTKGKQELDPAIIASADIVVADSISQCIDHGEIADAVEKKLIAPDTIIELGNLIKSGKGRDNNQQITIADLTGVATQDIQIAKIIHETIQNSQSGKI